MASVLSIAACALNLVAFVLLLLATLSGFYIKSINLMILPYVPDSFPITSDLRIGILGFCDTNIVGQNDCFGPRLGYSIPSDIVSRDSLPLTVALMLNLPLMYTLVLHPICVAFSGLCAIFSLFIAHRVWSGIAPLIAIVNAKLATIAFIVDVVLVIHAKQLVDEGSIVVFWGAVPWITLAAVLLIWASVVLLIMNIFRSRRQQKSGG